MKGSYVPSATTRQWLIGAGWTPPAQSQRTAAASSYDPPPGPFQTGKFVDGAWRPVLHPPVSPEVTQSAEQLRAHLAQIKPAPESKSQTVVLGAEMDPYGAVHLFDPRVPRHTLACATALVTLSTGVFDDEWPQRDESREPTAGVVTHWRLASDGTPNGSIAACGLCSRDATAHDEFTWAGVVTCVPCMERRAKFTAHDLAPR